MGREEETRALFNRASGPAPEAAALLLAIYDALKERGYDPVRQLAYFLLTGEPTYITAHKGARSLAARLERDEVLEELVRTYLHVHRPGEDRGR